MGILNVTPDSFFDGGKYNSVDAALRQAALMIEEGAWCIDVGGMSSRPGAEILAPEAELARVVPVIEAIALRFPEVLISVDTVHGYVARHAIDCGAVIINDISAGRIDPGMLEVVAASKVPYILMHMQGSPSKMQLNPQYEDVVLEVLDFFIQNVGRLRQMGIEDILLDPGFGFGKTLEHNYRLLHDLEVLKILGLPLLAGISRKSMVYRPLGIGPEEALNPTCALHMVALQRGAKVLRAHDVRAATEVIRLWQILEKAGSCSR